MAAHEGPANLRPRCTRSGSSVAAIPVYLSSQLCISVLYCYGDICYMVMMMMIELSLGNEYAVAQLVEELR
jgi:hypothetical protein